MVTPWLLGILGFIGVKIMKEKTITNKILKYLKEQPCCFAFKEHGGAYGTAGIPDIICCYNGKFGGITGLHIVQVRTFKNQLVFGGNFYDNERIFIAGLSH